MSTDPDTDPSSVAFSRHVPVMVAQVVAHLAPHDGGVYVDGTFGAGGYAAATLAAANVRVIGIDRDPEAIEGGEGMAARAGGRLMLQEGRFSDLDALAASLGIHAVDGVMLDLGISSMQVDQPERGFSFRHDGPLDMRMGSAGTSAADVVAAASERDLATIIYTLGEERHSRAVARAIVAARKTQPIATTAKLAEIVGSVVHVRPNTIHPATRTFQALRLFVNEELHELAAGLAAAERILRPGGRLVVVSFHSLEDRIVKLFLASRSAPPRGSRHLPETVTERATFAVLTRRPEVPDEAEIADNPRSRSAKLRAAERTDAPLQTGRGADDDTGAPQRLPSLADVMRGG